MKIKYVGPLEAVEVWHDGQTYTVARNHTVEVPDDLGGSLVEQGVWEETRTTKAKEG